MLDIVYEFLFWVFFIGINAIAYSIVYILHRDEKASFWPYISTWKLQQKLGLVASENLDPFRYCVELSVLLLVCRVWFHPMLASVATILYVFLLVFNLYQYAIRKVYYTDPFLFNDLKLIKNAFVIVWSESKSRLIIAIPSILVITVGIYQFFQWFFTFFNDLGTSDVFYVISSLWLVMVVYSIYKFKGLYKEYPKDIFLRYHYILVESFMNLKRSWEHYQMSKLKVGQKYQDSRAGITIEPIHQLPNLYFLLVESYGSYFYKNNSGKEVSFETLRNFEKDLVENGYKCVSAFSESTTIGGQSWLTYTSMLFGYRIDNNTLFENHLNDENFRKSKGLLQFLQSLGYHNYNLNPITPIVGLHVPYDEMRSLYAIDTWFLADDIDYSGDQYGFGQCAPDQYSLNKAMEMIQRDEQSPYTLFYLTKNSHTPFIAPPVVDNWKDLNKSGEKQRHIHEGFFKNPSPEDYQNAIKYEFDIIRQFIKDYGKQEDIFIVMGDHQPPILANKEQHGLTTPVHIISQNDEFLSEFHKYGFTKDLIEAKDPTIKHEAFYSIFLNAFANQFSGNPKNIPEYEPEGIKL